MTLFRIRLRLEAPLGTPLTSGTMFGHLCWAKREGAGEQALSAWLDALPEAPWALSDGFPAGFLPKPLVRSTRRHTTEKMTIQVLKRLEKNKKRAKWPWLPANTWSGLRGRLSDPLLQACAASGSALAHRIAHNSIDRRTGSTPEEGGLYFVDEDWSHVTMSERDVYARAETTPGELQALFAAVGEAGYGRDTTWGRGQFTVVDVTDASCLTSMTATGC